MKQMNYEQDSEMLKALGHPVRLKMVEGLMADNGCNVTEIVEKLDIPQSTASQHLRVLRTTGVITFRKSGVKTCYRVNNERVKKIIKILSA